MPVAANPQTPANPQPAQSTSSPASSGSTPGVATTAAPTQQQNLQGQANNTITGLASGQTPAGVAANAAASHLDYLDRQGAVGSNLQKVSLVGRTGAGTRSLTSGFGNSNITKLGNPTTGAATNLSVVTFEVQPDMSESGTTVLIDIGDIRAAASVVIYMGSPSRSFTITAKFVSTTAAQATTNNNYLNVLKAWRMPTSKLGESFGAEPETLRLFAYGNVIRGIPVMIQSLNVEYSSEVDYIMDSTGKVWVPIVQTVSIGLKEVRSVDDLSSFDYASYKAGTLTEW
jgi:hypothetical protein